MTQQHDNTSASVSANASGLDRFGVARGLWPYYALTVLCFVATVASIVYTRFTTRAFAASARSEQHGAAVVEGVVDLCDGLHGLTDPAVNVVQFGVPEEQIEKLDEARREFLEIESRVREQGEAIQDTASRETFLATLDRVAQRANELEESTRAVIEAVEGGNMEDAARALATSTQAAREADETNEGLHTLVREHRKAELVAQAADLEQHTLLGTFISSTLLVSALGLSGYSVWLGRTLNAKTKALVEAKAAADLANSAKSRFLASMSHEIRTPVTAILGYADILREQVDQPMSGLQQAQTVDTIRTAGRHLLTVINDILDLSKIEADKMTVEKIETPICSILREVESLMRSRSSIKGVTLDVVLQGTLPERIMSDPTRVRQILLNLIGNAVKFTSEGSVRVLATVQQRGPMHSLVIDVEDTGPGMSDEQAGHLFVAFRQADASMARKFGGSGLGLTISKCFATLMGGSVTLERTEVGKGSCFRLELPLEACAGARMIDSLDAVGTCAESYANAAAVVLKGRVLLAEDGPDNQRLIAYHLRKAGAVVDIADNGRIAMEMMARVHARGERYDLLLTDMQMPDVDGYTLASTLREQGNTISIVALTAHAMPEDRAACILAGCDHYASKPIDKVKLLETCEHWICRQSGAGRRAA